MSWKKNYLVKRLLLTLLCVIILFLSILSLKKFDLIPEWLIHSKEHLYSQQFLYFGTLIDVKLTTDSNQNAQQAFNHLNQELARMHRDWHAWQPSLVTQINTACSTGESIVVPNDLAELLRRGKEYYFLSDGLFNPAAAKIISAWGFLNNEPNKPRTPPDQHIIDSLLQQKPSMADIEITKNRVKCRNPAVQLDLGGYAKGFAIDKLLDYLASQGISNALIDAGGDIGIRGKAIDRPWKIAIKDPFSDKPLKMLDISGPMSVFTSGSYARKFTHGKSQYTHIIDPRTGQPVTGFVSVTVLQKEAATADAAATAIMVAGPANWEKIAQKFHLERVFIVTQNQQVLEWSNNH